MSLSDFRRRLRADLESKPVERGFGSGWISGTLALVLAVAGFFLVVSLRFPSLLAVAELRALHAQPLFRAALHFLLLGAFMLALFNLILRPVKILGFTAIGLVLMAELLGGSHVAAAGELGSGIYLGLDWFVLNVIMTGLLFVPLERLFPNRAEQGIFRDEWREDLFYYFISSMLVQVLTFLTFQPARLVTASLSLTSVREWVAAQPVVLQFFEVMFLTDLVQYWVHRAFHRIPFMWRFHAVHHSARNMDWMAGARMHFMEILILRGLTVMPMIVLGFREPVIQAYVLMVYFHSTFIHANVRWQFPLLGRFLVTPRFHHWHHGIEKEAIDVNFAIHFTFIDRVFGTLHLPENKWPTGYGIGGHPVPVGYWKQFLYPFRKKR